MLLNTSVLSPLFSPTLPYRALPSQQRQYPTAVPLTEPTTFLIRHP